MSSPSLPDRASLEYLRKLAKERLRELRQANPHARLSAAQLAIARDHGFPNWRALKAEVDRRRNPTTTAFFAACHAGDLAALRDLLDRDPTLALERNRDGATGLHLAVQHPDAVRLLLERARIAVAGEATGDPEVRFTQDLHTAFYGQREFGLRDPNGVEVMFCQPVEEGH